MNQTKFKQKVDQYRFRLSELSRSQRENLTAAPSVEQLLQEMTTAMEELQVAEEELRAQNEYILAGEDEIRNERNRYQNLFSFSPDCLLLTDSGGKILEANRAAGQLFNLDPNWLVGKPLLAFITMPDRYNFRVYLKKATTWLKLKQWEAHIKPLKKAPIHVAVTCDWFPTGPGDKDTIIWSIRDVTSRKNAENGLRESEMRFHTIFQQADIGMALVDESGQILECNPAFQDILQYSDDELGQRSLVSLFHPDEKSEARRIGDLLNRREVHYRGEARLQTRSGEVRWARMLVTTFHLRTTSTALYAIVMIENITYQRALQIELSELKHRLLVGSELERATLSQDLHDGPLQDLYGVFYKFEFRQK